MPQNLEPLENLVDQFARFPGIGRKGATRMAYEIMGMSNEQAMELAQAIEHAKRCAPLPHLPGLHRRRNLQDLPFPKARPQRDLRGGKPARHQIH